MKILVTGGRGFVGRALVRKLRSDGHDVFSLDILHDSDPKHLRADIRSFPSLENILEKGLFHQVYHLAAEAGRWNGESHYEAMWSTNVIGTKHLIRLQERLKFRLVFLSSSEVYGDFEGVMSEDIVSTVPIRLLNDYAMSKWVGEMQIVNSAEMTGTESVRVRMFNVYGPGETWAENRGMIARFVWSALEDRPYTVFLNHSRTSTYIEDAVRCLGSLVSNFRPGAVYNLGGLEYHDVKTVSDMILTRLNTDDRRVSYVSQEEFTTRHKRVDISRAIRELGFHPEVSLADGLDRTIQWARSVNLEIL